MLMHVFLQIPGRVQYNTAALSLSFNKEILFKIILQHKFNNYISMNENYSLYMQKKRRNFKNNRVEIFF